MNAALDELQAVMFKWKDQRSVVKPTLHCVEPDHWHRLQFVEEVDDERQWYNQHFEDCVKWANEKLKDWPDCKRMAHDMWDFKHRQDAEKFITIFHLSWDQ